MAVFEYECGSCGLRKEKLFRSEPPDHIECPACSKEARRMLSDFGFQFADGKVLGNTGVDSLDNDHDKAIGRDAKTRWEYVKDRNSRKRKIQREVAGKDGEAKVPLQLNQDGEYEPLPESGLDRFRKLHTEYDQMLTEHRKERREADKTGQEE